jgi:UDP-glucuronate 4-epimerase
MPKVVITGMAGFIGFHTAIQFSEDYDVMGFDNFNNYYDPKLKINRADHLKDKYGIECSEIDLRNKDDVSDFIWFTKPDLVIHLAAMAGVRYSMDNAQEYIDNNVTGTLNLIQACEASNVPNIIYASTSCTMHGNSLPWKESDKLGHQLSPYGYTKQLNEHMFHISKIPNAVGLRFFTVYGPWGRPDMALFNFTENITAGNPIYVFNDGNMKRDFTYVDDIVDGITIVSNNMTNRDIYNIGNGKQVELMDFVNYIEDNLGLQANINFKPKHPADAQETWSDCTKLKQLGYNPKTPVEVGVKEFVQWYRNYYGRNE